MSKYRAILEVEWIKGSRVVMNVLGDSEEEFKEELNYCLDVIGGRAGEKERERSKVGHEGYIMCRGVADLDEFEMDERG